MVSLEGSRGNTSYLQRQIFYQILHIQVCYLTILRFIFTVLFDIEIKMCNSVNYMTKFSFKKNLVLYSL